MNVKIRKDEAPKVKTIEEQMNELSDKVQSALLIKLSDAANNADKIAQDVADKFMDALQRDARTVMLKMMGFDSHFGIWEIDHCNGRAGQSPIGDVTKSIFQKMAIDFVEKHRDEIFSITQKEHDQIIKSMHSAFRSRLSGEAIKVMNRVVDAYLEESADKLVKQFDDFDVFSIAGRLIDCNKEKVSEA